MRFGTVRGAPGQTASAAGAPPGLAPVALLLLVMAVTGPNIVLATLSVAVLVAGSLLLWRPGEPPVLLLTFVYAWFGCSIATFHSNWLGEDVSRYTLMVSDMSTAVALSLVGLLVIAVFMRLAAGPVDARLGLEARALALSQPLQVWFRAYLIAAVGSFFAGGVVWLIPGLSQIVLAFMQIKWAFYFMLAYAHFLRRADAGWYFGAAFVLELALGIGGYFSDFKTVFMITFLAVAASRVRLSTSSLVGVGALVSLLIMLGVVWTAVKGEYRSFVSQGEAAQTINVDYQARMTKLGQLVADLTPDSLADGADRMLRRLSYVEFFGIVLNFVPASEPHSNGAILLDAVVRPFTPRIFFPNKTEIDDTARTNQYTGGIAGDNQATSISIGYIGEAYIDFGVWGMFPALALIGYIYGAVYRRLLMARNLSALLGGALAGTVLWGVLATENSFTKVFGGVAAFLLTAWLCVTFAFPVYFPWLLKRPGEQ